MREKNGIEMHAGGLKCRLYLMHMLNWCECEQRIKPLACALRNAYKSWWTSCSEAYSKKIISYFFISKALIAMTKMHTRRFQLLLHVGMAREAECSEPSVRALRRKSVLTCFPLSVFAASCLTPSHCLLNTFHEERVNWNISTRKMTGR